MAIEEQSIATNSISQVASKSSRSSGKITNAMGELSMTKEVGQSAANELPDTSDGMSSIALKLQVMVEYFEFNADKAAWLIASRMTEMGWSCAHQLFTTQRSVECSEKVSLNLLNCCEFLDIPVCGYPRMSDEQLKWVGASLVSAKSLPLLPLTRMQ